MIIKVVAFLFLTITSSWAKLPEAVSLCFKNIPENKIEEFSPKYAEGFHYYKKGSATLVDLQGQFFFLGQEEQNALCPQFPHFVIPLKKVITFSTTHLPFLKLLNKEETVLGFAGMELVNNGTILKRFKKGEVKELGYPAREELLLGLKPQAIFTFAVQKVDEQELQRQKKLGLPMIPIAEYKEKNPLARAEWLLVMGLFFNEEKLAQKIFTKQEKDYQDLLQKVRQSPDRPLVLMGELRNGIWYAPGGESDLAKLVEDAGANYLWKEKKGRGFITLPFEEVLQTLTKVGGNLFWLPQNTWEKSQEIVLADSRYQSLGLIKKTKIFNNNLKHNTKGYSDYWETGIANPDLLLKDLVSIFHPEILKSHSRLWYWELRP